MSNASLSSSKNFPTRKDFAILPVDKSSVNSLCRDKITNRTFFWHDSNDSEDYVNPFLNQNAEYSDDGGSMQSKKVETKTVTYKPPEITIERGGWGNKLDFLFSCISLSVGLGNVWRFPYLCYKNGGGAFLVTYTIAMIFCGIPMFYQEVAIGQFLGSGGMTFIGQLVPILKGVGYATMTIVFLLDIYYCIIIAWTLYYLICTFASVPYLPWSDCDNWWNTESCSTGIVNKTILTAKKESLHPLNLTVAKSTTPVEEFFDHKVLGISSGIEDVGGMQWQLFTCLVIGWILIYSVIRKGLHQSGKIIWFTATFPYVVLIILLVKSVTLEGASEGLLYYVTPRWEELLTPGPWMDGATQIFFAYSIGCGALPALGSYNKFHHNCYKDAVITCIINTLTSLLAGAVTFSILGHLADELGTNVGTVVKSGPGLVFLTYPEVVLKLPGAAFWAITFFVMLVVLGIDSEFCLVESFITGVVDNWSDALRPHRNTFTVIICAVMFALGIPMVTHGGMYVFQLMDYYSASGMSLLWVCFFQTIAISWIFGVEKLSDSIEQMMGIRPSRFWTICWRFCAPVVMFVIFISQCMAFQPLTYGKNYTFPTWSNVIGFVLSFSSMAWVPIYALYYVLAGPGTIWKNIQNGLQPQIRQRKISIHDKQSGLLKSDSFGGMLTPSPSFTVDNLD